MNKALFNAQIAQYATPTIKGEDRVYLPNSIKCYLPSLAIEGNTYQADYQGKNLFDITRAELTGCEWQDNMIMSNASSVYIDIIVPPGKYTLSFDRNAEFAIYLTDGKVASGYFGAIAATNTSATFTFPASYDGYLRIKWFDAGNAISNIQLIYEDIVPSPTNPIDIVNASDNGLEVMIKNSNVFNAVTYHKYKIGGCLIEGKNNIFTLTGENVQGVAAGLTYPVENLKPNTTYTFRITRLSGSNKGADLRFYIFTGTSSLVYKNTACSIYTTTGEQTAVGRYTFKEEDLAKGIACGVYSYATSSTGATYDNCKVRADIIEGNYTAATMPPYSPYFESTISIPSTVGDLELKFAKVDDSADTLVVDKVSNKVSYIKKIEYFKLEQVEPYQYVSFYSLSNANGIHVTGLPALEHHAKGYCNRAKVASLSKNIITIGANTKYVYWVGILDTLGFTNNWVDKSNPTAEEKSQAMADIRNWLVENPTYVYYKLSTPIEYDITDTEFG